MVAVEENPVTPPATNAEAKPAVAINIKVCDQGGNEITFKIKRTKPLEKIVQAYCHAKDIKDPKMVRFCFEGERILPNATPESLEMEDEDRIDVYLEQQGGGI